MKTKEEELYDAAMGSGEGNPPAKKPYNTEEQQLWDNVVLNMIQRNSSAEKAVSEANGVIHARRLANRSVAT